MEELLNSLSDHPNWLKILILSVSTLVSEDLTTISAGILVSQEVLNPFTAIAGCFIGIFVGDGLLYLAGLVLGKRALKLPFVQKFVPEKKVNECAEWFQKNGLAVIILSRFIPGTRLPTYFAAGLLGSKAKFFLLAAAFAVAIWTPLLVCGAWLFGERFATLLGQGSGARLSGLVLGVLALFLFLRLVGKLGDWKNRRRFRSRMRRISRWEFWPLWVFYFPVFFYNLWLALRNRRAFLPLISNPGIAYSGYIGESKSEIMASFRGYEEFFAKFLLLPGKGPVEEKCERVLAWMSEKQILFPVFLKPDVGQRGTGVRKIRDKDELASYFSTTRVAVHIQEFIPGPYEFGIFYLRFPNQEKGTVISLTGKEFPFVVGDGERNLEELILQVPSGMGRYHIYRERFKSRLKEVLGQGEALPLISTGNHCLGTIFNDSNHLTTPELVEKIDAISKSIDGFYIGRYDVRTSNLEDLRKGLRFKIIELNGAAAEQGHIYDTRHGLFFAYHTMFRQYRHLWKIGAQNEKRGHKTTSPRALLKAYLDYSKMEKDHPSSE